MTLVTSRSRAEGGKRTAQRGFPPLAGGLTQSESRPRSRADRTWPSRLLLGAIAVAGLTEAARIRRRRAARYWTPPSGAVTHGPLAARRLGSSGPPVVLMHGMAGSQLYWGGDFDVVSQTAKLVAVDLLGFGDSPKPASGYGPREHADAMAACLRDLGIDEPAVLVGHSMGALVAIAVATYHPEVVDRVVAIAPPIYASRVEGMRHIRAMGTLEGLMAFGSTSRLMCRWMCNHRALASRLAPLVEPSLPPAIARAAVLHTWGSYSQSMEELILSSAAPGWLETATRRVHLIAALDDPVPDLPLLSRLCESNDLVLLDIWPRGGHHLPLTQPARCVAAIAAAVDNVGRGPTPQGDGRQPVAATAV